MRAPMPATVSVWIHYDYDYAKFYSTSFYRCHDTTWNECDFL